jgi:hypothetical protein
MIIPEHMIYNFIEKLIEYIRKDSLAHSNDMSKSFLYSIFGDLHSDKTYYLKEAFEIFTRKIDDPRQINLRLFFNADQIQSRPIVHITMMSDTPQFGELGMGESGEQDFNTFDIEEETITPHKIERLMSVMNVVITSVNELECLIIYRSLQAVILAAIDTLQLSGWQNPKIGGQDLRMPNDPNVPTSIYYKLISISGFYDLQIPITQKIDIIKELNVRSGYVLPS